MRISAAPRGVHGAVRVPGDKSISHRALLFAALAQGRSTIVGLGFGADVVATRGALEALGASIQTDGTSAVVDGTGRRFGTPGATLDCMNSGTSMRLLMGILAGTQTAATLDGDASLRRRPMLRIAEPLRAMGAHIALASERHAPVQIAGGNPLTAIDYTLPVASAQLKSAVLLAGLGARGRTTVREAVPSRDHTERMLPLFGVAVAVHDGAVSVDGGATMRAADIRVPGDPSSAAYWLAAAATTPESEITVTGVSLNPTRLGFVGALERMGATIERTIAGGDTEPYGTLRASTSALHGITLGPEDVPAIIDELPLLAVVATRAHGTTRVCGAAELRVKESDRLEMLARNFANLGLVIELFEDGFAIEGPQLSRGGTVESAGDHRIAMAFSIGALAAQSATTIDDARCVGVSYPEFYRTLDALVA